MSEQFQNTTEKSLEKVKLIPNPQIHDRSLSELGTGASIKSVGLNWFYGLKSPLLVKWYGHASVFHWVKCQSSHIQM